MRQFKLDTFHNDDGDFMPGEEKADTKICIELRNNLTYTFQNDDSDNTFHNYDGDDMPGEKEADGEMPSWRFPFAIVESQPHEESSPKLFDGRSYRNIDE